MGLRLPYLGQLRIENALLLVCTSLSPDHIICGQIDIMCQWLIAWRSRPSFYTILGFMSAPILYFPPPPWMEHLLLGKNAVLSPLLTYILASFSQLTHSFNVPKSHFFFLIFTDSRLFQDNFPNKPSLSEIDMIPSVSPCQRGSISELYSAIFSFQSISTDSLPITWSQDISKEIDEETWAL